MKKFFQISFVVFFFTLVVKTFFIDTFVVRGDSMEPAFRDGDYLILDKVSYHFYKPQKGDVVVVRSEEPDQNFIKRIVGLPGERIEIQNGIIAIKKDRVSEGKILEEPYLFSGAITPIDTVIALDDEEYFIMGDNRLFSIDSRTLGPFSASRFKGRVLFSIHPNPFFLLSRLNFFSE